MTISVILLLCPIFMHYALAVTWHKLDNVEYYVSVSDSKNFNGSSSVCAGMNATLAKVDSSNIQTFLKNLAVQKKGFYIGLKRIASGGEFRWLDGTALVYTSWGNQQPDNGGNTVVDESCVTMGISWSTNLLWYDFPCGTSCGYICQRTVETPTTSESASTSPLPTTIASTLQTTTALPSTVHSVSSTASLVSTTTAGQVLASSVVVSTGKEQATISLLDSTSKPISTKEATTKTKVGASSEESSNVVIIAASSAGGFVLLLVVVISVGLVCKRKEKNKPANNEPAASTPTEPKVQYVNDKWVNTIEGSEKSNAYTSPNAEPEEDTAYAKINEILESKREEDDGVYLKVNTALPSLTNLPTPPRPKQQGKAQGAEYAVIETTIKVGPEPSYAAIDQPSVSNGGEPPLGDQYSSIYDIAKLPEEVVKIPDVNDSLYTSMAGNPTLDKRKTAPESSTALSEPKQIREKLPSPTRDSILPPPPQDLYMTVQNDKTKTPPESPTAIFQQKLKQSSSSTRDEMLPPPPQDLYTTVQKGNSILAKSRTLESSTAISKPRVEQKSSLNTDEVLLPPPQDLYTTVHKDKTKPVPGSSTKSSNPDNKSNPTSAHANDMLPPPPQDLYTTVLKESKIAGTLTFNEKEQYVNETNQSNDMHETPDINSLYAVVNKSNL